jgi:hypothetical protein
MNTCFGYNPEKKNCRVLTELRCAGCSFYRTETDRAADVARADRRLRSLTIYSQISIAGTYYGGKMPWSKGGVRDDR